MHEKKQNTARYVSAPTFTSFTILLHQHGLSYSHRTPACTTHSLALKGSRTHTRSRSGYSGAFSVMLYNCTERDSFHGRNATAEAADESP